MAPKPKTSQEATETVSKLQDQRAALRQKQENNLGKLAAKAGLVELDIGNKELLEAFKEVAARFQNTAKA